MASLNRVMLIGNLTRDPELRYTTSGTGICGMRLAVHRRYRVDGQDREETCFVDVDAFGRQAETCNQYLSKGSGILVEGRLRYDEWDDRETGRKRSKLQVIAERVQFMPRSDGQRHKAAGQQPSATQQMQAPVAPVAQPHPSATQQRVQPQPPAPSATQQYAAPAAPVQPQTAPAAPAPQPPPAPAQQPPQQAPSAPAPQPPQAPPAPTPTSVAPPAPQSVAPPVAPQAPAGAPPPPVFPSSTESIDDIPF